MALARCCTGHALRDVAAFLRLAYSPHLAELHLLQPLAPQLPALLRLAHASSTRWLLQELAAFMEGATRVMLQAAGLGPGVLECELVLSPGWAGKT